MNSAQASTAQVLKQVQAGQAGSTNNEEMKIRDPADTEILK